MFAYIALGLSFLAPQNGASTEFRPRWETDGVSLAIREGLLPEYMYGIYKSRTRDFGSRYELAVYIHLSVTKHLERTEESLDGTTDDVERASLIRAKALLPFYRRGAKEFAREFKSLDIKGDFGIARLETLLNRLERQSPQRALQFADVPSNHWAAKAVGDLRALGMLDGYPDGRYRG